MQNRSHCKLTRHDPHNLEIKFQFEGEPNFVRCRTDLYLFLPSSVKAGSWSKDELMSDFNSRLRLSLSPSANESDTLHHCFAAFEHSVQLFIRAAAPRNGSEVIEGTQDSLMRNAQKLGAIVGEAIKKRKAKHARELFLIHSRASFATRPSEALSALAHEIAQTAVPMRRLHLISENVKSKNVPYFALLLEYTDHLYIQYLGHLTSEFGVFRKAHCDGEKFATGWATLREMLQTLSSEICTLQKDQRLARKENQTHEEFELLRLGHLKKFFQAQMFVEVSRNQSSKRFTEPAAAVAAGLAALWATFWQTLERSKSSSLGIKGTSIVCLGVMAYILKDRIKDRGRHFLTKRIARFVPDKVLNLNAQEKTIGQVREWFYLRTNAQIPVEIQAQRRAAQISEAESHLSEEVIAHSRQFSIECERQTAGHPVVLHESLRINIERYLKHMDDAFKNITCLDDNGHFTHRSAHKVYPFYAFIKVTKQKENDESKGQATFYGARVVVDKTGIQRVEKLAPAEYPVPYSATIPQVDLAALASTTLPEAAPAQMAPGAFVV